MIVPDHEKAESADEHRLLREIASAEGERRRSLLARHEAIYDVWTALVRIWLCLDWYRSTSEDGELQERRNILLYACCNLFYSFWNLCGKVTNELRTLGYDYSKYGPSLAQLLKDHPRSQQPLLRLIAPVFESETQRRIVKLRHLYNHQRGARFGCAEVEDIRLVKGKPKRILRADTEGTSEETFALLTQGFLELFRFFPTFQQRFDDECRSIDGGA
jgi:hypothetical protein